MLLKFLLWLELKRICRQCKQPYWNKGDLLCSEQCAMDWTVAFIAGGPKQ